MPVEKWKKFSGEYDMVTGDPKFRNIEAGDFSFRRGTAAKKINFRQLETDRVGPRPGKSMQDYKPQNI